MFDDEKGRQTEIKYLQSSFEEYKGVRPTICYVLCNKMCFM